MNDSESSPFDASLAGLYKFCPTDEFINNAPNRDGTKYDPVENTEKYKNIVSEIDKMAEGVARIQFGVTPQQCGYCHFFWSVKQILLKRKGITWYSLDQLNPDHFID